MKREEILEKSRQEKRDEGKEFVLDKGRKSGVIGMVIIFCILAVFNLYNNRQETNSALIAMMFGYLGFEGLGLYKVTKRKLDLIKIIAGCVISISFLVIYLTKVSN
ncbi:DUF6442 family protein [Paenibacillus wynnii]|uniref:DUF3953 domain-containing protein n=1 Tax=Paenibacillus wynnii TaxID=268407 RepID=A0A098M9K0_9BACL|nr:DUF6442 family protein [Paenibacillus wynnii]KGE18728.1 hypothetical protein PWYN_04600 [Paenibacillus wynnii]